MALPDPIRVRVRAYAKAKGFTVPVALAVLVDAGLRAYDRAVAAGTARAATFTPDQARAAVSARKDRQIQKKCDSTCHDAHFHRVTPTTP